jgi:hypothetical protein
MNSPETGGPCWRADLAASRDLDRQEKAGFPIILGWYEKWRIGAGLLPGRDSAAAFWRAQVMAKPREPWQLEQWAAAMRWYFAWLHQCQEGGSSGICLEERVRRAVDRTGARRGLAWRTRRTYAGWAGRFARWAGDSRSAMDPEKAREWLTSLVAEGGVAFSTQKQALNALAFFFKEVCGQEQVDLGVKMRRTQPRMPVVLSLHEVALVLARLPQDCRLAAELQYGSGLRLNEVNALRVKDVDQDRGQVTVRGGSDLGTLEELLGHADLRTSQIYTHVARDVGDCVLRSPLDSWSAKETSLLTPDDSQRPGFAVTGWAGGGDRRHQYRPGSEYHPRSPHPPYHPARHD